MKALEREGVVFRDKSFGQGTATEVATALLQPHPLALERMILARFTESDEGIINSLHFADDTAVIADSIEALNILLEIVSEWADAFHLEIRPDKSIFYTNDVQRLLTLSFGLPQKLGRQI